PPRPPRRARGRPRGPRRRARPGPTTCWRASTATPRSGGPRLDSGGHRRSDSHPPSPARSGSGATMGPSGWGACLGPFRVCTALRRPEAGAGGLGTGRAAGRLYGDPGREKGPLSGPVATKGPSAFPRNEEGPLRRGGRFPRSVPVGDLADQVLEGLPLSLGEVRVREGPGDSLNLGGGAGVHSSNLLSRRPYVGDFTCNVKPGCNRGA